MASVTYYKFPMKMDRFFPPNSWEQITIWWLTYPLKNMSSSDWIIIPTIGENNPFMFQTTNQKHIFPTIDSSQIPYENRINSSHHPIQMGTWQHRSCVDSTCVHPNRSSHGSIPQVTTDPSAFTAQNARLDATRYCTSRNKGCTFHGKAQSARENMDQKRVFQIHGCQISSNMHLYILYLFCVASEHILVGFL